MYVSNRWESQVLLWQIVSKVRNQPPMDLPNVEQLKVKLREEWWVLFFLSGSSGTIPVTIWWDYLQSKVCYTSDFKKIVLLLFTHYWVIASKGVKREGILSHLYKFIHSSQPYGLDLLSLENCKLLSPLLYFPSDNTVTLCRCFRDDANLPEA